MAMMGKAAFWPATGKYVEEAEASARSFRAHHPDIPCLLITDKPCKRQFDEVLVRPLWPECPWYVRSVIYYNTILSYPYDAFLAFDTDVYFCGPIHDLYEILGRFDLVGTHAPVRVPGLKTATPVPHAFATINVGVLGFKNNEIVASLFRRWLWYTLNHRDTHRYGRLTDQVPLREALWEDERTRIWVAPPEYNCRFTFGLYAQGPVRVLHNRTDDAEGVSRSINATERPRVWKNGTLQP